MKIISSILLTAIICSCSSQKNATPGKSDSVTVTTVSSNETKSATPTKSVILNNPQEGANETKSPTPTKSAVLNNPASISNAPKCILDLIKAFKEEDVQNPPRKMYSYTYKGSTVYYVTPPCCDFFSDLYDENCKLIAHPDGGITGKGDGRLKDFSELKSNEKLVWEDSRKYR